MAAAAICTSCSGTPRSRQLSGLLSRLVICSWLLLQEYFATYAATCSGHSSRSPSRAPARTRVCSCSPDRTSTSWPSPASPVSELRAAASWIASVDLRAQNVPIAVAGEGGAGVQRLAVPVLSVLMHPRMT
jgi:hypothetical protein